MPESFGARLRQQRERQQIALPAIAEQTKIKLALLDGLERDDVSRWPTGIFRRAFVRAYAHAIALEPDVVVREFLELYPDQLEAAATEPLIASGADDAATTIGPPSRLRCLVNSAFDSLSRLRLGGGPKDPPVVTETMAVDTLAVDTVVRDTVAPRVAAPVMETVANPVAVPVAEVAAPKRSARSTAVAAKAGPEPNLLAAAQLCVELGRLDGTCQVGPLLQEAARILDAVGLIVWVWHPQAAELRPELAHGYSDKVLAQLPKVGRDADNATASAFRSAHACVVNSRDLASGAMVVPLMTPAGCAGVLAIELQHGREQRASVRAFATIFAAQLARVVGVARLAEEANRRLA